MSDHKRTTDTQPNDTVQLTAHEYNELVKIAEFCSGLVPRVRDLEEQAKNPKSPIDGRREPNVSDPQHFSGKREELQSFLTQARLVFQLQPSRFQSERQKVLYAVSFLRGTAFSWFEPFITQTPAPTMLDDFEIFAFNIMSAFGDPNQAVTAEREIRNLRQHTSVTTYSSDFQRLAAFLTWNDAAMCSQFYWGLKDPIKDELAKVDRPDNLVDLMTLAIKIDTRRYERLLERKTNGLYSNNTMQNLRSQFSHDNSNYPVQTSTHHYEPMEIESANSHQKRGPLSLEEKKRRFDNSLCMYCGNPNHFASKCPLRPDIKIAATSFGKDPDYEQYLKFLEFQRHSKNLDPVPSPLSGKVNAQNQ